MIIIITGSSHTGKTCLAQKLLEKNSYPYLSIDHLKMGLIRSGYTNLTPVEDDKLTKYLWPIVREIIKTAIENRQNLIVEGCHIPYDFSNDLTDNYLAQIQYINLIFSKRYIEDNYNQIISFQNSIEKRLSDEFTQEEMIRENLLRLDSSHKYGCPYTLIDNGNYYNLPIDDQCKSTSQQAK